MALPPEPLDDLREDIALAFVGSVETAEVVKTDSATGPIGAAADRPQQRIDLKVLRPIFGQVEVGQMRAAIKPASAYVLVKGVEGVFLLDETGHILGCQGPDTWREAEVNRVLSAEAEQ